MQMNRTRLGYFGVQARVDDIEVDANASLTRVVFSQGRSVDEDGNVIVEAGEQVVYLTDSQVEAFAAVMVAALAQRMERQAREATKGA